MVRYLQGICVDMNEILDSRKMLFLSTQGGSLGKEVCRERGWSAPSVKTSEGEGRDDNNRDDTAVARRHCADRYCSGAERYCSGSPAACQAVSEWRRCAGETENATPEWIVSSPGGSSCCACCGA